ncbi:AAA family ATPase, partial [Vibrio fluvialis]|nr:AAA family ATPase [Vibrio fluvialis]
VPRFRASNTPLRYSKPILDNILEVRKIKSRRVGYGEEAFIGDISLKHQMDELVGGDYVLEDKQIYFQPNDRDVLVPIRSSSGSSKSLLLLDYFIHNMSNYGALVIDEPELNLHLDSQKEVARVLCAIANSGIQVIVTTHSDHFIREVNNLIMLSSEKISSDDRLRIMKKANISKSSIISPADVSTVVISSKERKTYTMPISEYGIDLELFNEEIMKSNDITNELISSIYGG